MGQGYILKAPCLYGKCLLQLEEREARVTAWGAGMLDFYAAGIKSLNSSVPQLPTGKQGDDSPQQTGPKLRLSPALAQDMSMALSKQ